MDIKKEVNIPLLRKDFTVDEYMIYEAKVIGASAVLLICAILDDEQLVSYLRLAHELGMSALVEAHDEEEVRRAIAAERHHRSEQQRSQNIYGGHHEQRSS